MAKSDTFPQLLRMNYEKYGRKKIAIRFKKFGIWKTCTWGDYYQNARLIGLGLKSIGLKKGDKVAVIGDNAPEGFFTELGVQALGAIMVGLYTDATPAELKYLVENADTRFVVADDQEQVDKFLEIREELPLLEKVIYWDPKGLINYDDPILMSYTKAVALGKEYERNNPGYFEECIDAGKADDAAVFLYTSGTSGLPKGAMLTFDNLISGVKAMMKLERWTEDSKSFSFLPFAWLPEQVLSIAGQLLSGGSVNFPEEPETVSADIREIGPTQLFYGSRLWEGLTSMMQARITESTFLKRLTYKALLPVGYRWIDMKTRGDEPNLLWKLAHAFADWILFRPIRDDMGLSHLNFAWSSGASLGPESYRLLQAIGIPIKNHYASTEACAVCNSGRELRPETVGRPVPGIEVKISEEGEILVKGRVVFGGYYKNSEATSKAIRNGWFHTGDAGFINDEGHLIFLDRLADLTELSNGEKVAPQYIESRLRFSPYIADAIVLADRDKAYVSAILTISFDMVGRWAEMNRVNYTTFTDLSQKEEVYNLILNEVERVNTSVPETSRIKRFLLLHKELDADESELTRTRKLKRDVIKERYGELIQGIYGDRDKISVEAQIKYRDGRTGVVKTDVRVLTVS
ncbi:MAG: long-chain fatty acid--CoA ligase [Desulfobacteraceae bacterium]|jgi:long-chain acyl-CoA synthetase|nr:MAG: long-chain fatty acid--CoA ligase [Desulfobacteraceae bacterium]